MSQVNKAAGLPDSARAFAEEIAAGQSIDLGTNVVGHVEIPKRLWVPVTAEEFVAAAIMAVLAGITLLNVLTRYLTNFSLAFTEEYSVVLLFVLVFVGVSSAIVKNSHIKVTFFTDMLSAGWRRAFDILGLFAMIVCFAVLIYYGADIAVDSYELGETSPGLGNPQWIYYAALPVLAACALLRVIGALIRELRNSKRGDA